MMRRCECLVLAVVWVSAVLLGCSSGYGDGAVAWEADGRPNIIVILVDDMGYSDIGATGGEIETPTLDRLASEGVLFTHMYNTSRCCPTRAALLTGQYQWDTGLGHMNTTNSPHPEYQRVMNEENVTIAEALWSAGYQTAMGGKWHVGDDRPYWPDRRGFDHFYGPPKGGGLYFWPSEFYDRPVYRDGELDEPEEGWYSTDGFTDYAIEYVKGVRDKDRPFFLYLAYVAPHFPLQAHERDIAKYEGRYDAGYEAIRVARFERQKAVGLVGADAVLPDAEHGPWASVKNKGAEAREMEVYAAMMDCLDQNLGRLMVVLEEEGIAENTVVMFLSDNGGCLADWNKTPNAELGTAQSNAAYGKWYNVSNTPYRKGKARTYEGGIVTPMIVHWPAGIERTGVFVREPTHVMDILPSCLEIAGVAYPESYEDRELDPVDGVSFVPLMNGGEGDADRALFFEHEGHRAARHGDWKLVANRGGAWELYNLADDPFEVHDLAGAEPEKAAELKAMYGAWAKAHGVRWPLK